ncbi:HEXXH motif domain-containing protein [Nocardia tengchongensis]|uniref:HEXXH motif domain-containing protein n=1 Tax=Nocardia tengchongensis TaxID=2055889 RepID=UPI00367B09D0
MSVADPLVDVAADLSTGHGSSAAMDVLTEGLLDMRIILMRTVVDTVEKIDPASAARAGLSQAYRALAELKGEQPELVARALCQPIVGQWAEKVLQRAAREVVQRAARGPGDAAIPLWADCAYLGWLAAALAVRCRPVGAARVVIRGGVVMLPGLGLARLADGDYCGDAEVRWNRSGAIGFDWDGGVLDITSAAEPSQPAWEPLRSMRAREDEPEIWLDDIDPFRALSPRYAGAPRLDQAQVDRWRRDLSGAWELLGDYLPALRHSLRSVAPLTADPRFDASSHTDPSGVGCVYTTAAADQCQLALTLIHEIQHTKFNLLIDQLELFTPDPQCRFYAPWRDDPRPILGLLHGIYAFFGVTDFWRAHRFSDCHGSLQAHADFALWRTQVGGALRQALGSGLLSMVGEAFFGNLEAAVRQWSEEDVPAAARIAAEEAATLHQTFWQTRNLVPDPDGIAELAARWSAGRPPIAPLPASTLIDQQHIHETHRGLPLATRLAIIEPGAANAISGLSDGDHAYLAGYLTEAVSQYSRDLRADPLCPQAWAGIGLAGRKIYGELAFRVLRERADVVARLYEVLGPDTDIPALVRWLSHSAFGMN